MLSRSSFLWACLALVMAPVDGRERTGSRARRWGYYPNPDYEKPTGKCCQICTNNFLESLNLLELPRHVERAALGRFYLVHASHATSTLLETRGQSLYGGMPSVGGMSMPGGKKPPECCSLCPEQYVPMGWYDRHSLLETKQSSRRAQMGRRVARIAAAAGCQRRRAGREDAECSTESTHPSESTPEGGPGDSTPFSDANAATPMSSFLEVEVVSSTSSSTATSVACGGGGGSSKGEPPACPGEHQCCYICGEKDHPPRDYMANVNLFLEVTTSYLERLRKLPWSRGPDGGNGRRTPVRTKAGSRATTPAATDPRFAALGHQRRSEMGAEAGAEAGFRKPGGCCVQCAIRLAEELPFSEPYTEADRHDWKRNPYAPGGSQG